MKTPSVERDGPDASKDQDRGPRELAPPTLIFGGFVLLSDNARVPSGGRAVLLEVEVDPYDMRIVDAACDCLGALGRRLLTELLVGRKVENGLVGAIAAVRSRYLADTQPAMIAALEDVLRRCAEHGIVGRRSTIAPDRTPKG